MSRLSPLASIILPLLVAASAGAQSSTGASGIISGVVQGAQGAPVPFASIALRRSADTVLAATTTTDSTGTFRITRVAPGNYRVEVRRIGFRMATRSGVTVTASATDVDLGVIRVEPTAAVLGGVAVRADRPAVAVLPDRNVYATRDIPVAAGGTATDVLRSIPDLEVSVEGRVTTGGAKPRIHINGRPAPMQGEALERYLQQLPAERIDRVEVISNPSARYAADGQGGIVDIVMRRGTGLGVSGSVALNAGTRNQQGGSGNVNFQKGRLSLFGSGSANFFGLRSRNSDVRQNLHVQPTTYIQQDSRRRDSGGMTSANLGAELQVGSGGTLWTELGIGRNTVDADAVTAYTHLDYLRTPTQRYDRVNESDLRGLFGSSAVGYRTADEERRNEWSVELRRNFNGGDNSNESARYRLNANGAALDPNPEMTFAGDARDQSDLSLEANLSRGWGKSGQVEAGYRGSWRHTGSDFRMQIDAPVGAPGTPAELDELVGDFRNRETIHAAFVSASQRIGRFSLQAGVRGEQAAVGTSLPLENATFESRYRSVFPSANLSTEVGAGVQLRLSYSKRVERPDAWILNPSTPALDPLNLQVGNPYLRPEYTHSLSLAVSRVGRAGMLQLSPYYRRTVGSWDQVRTVDEAGVSTVTWQNLATITAYGGRASASVRQLGPVSGLVSVSAHREVRDASNLGEDLSGSATRYSASSTLSLRATSALSLQGSLNYMPARYVPQGRISPMVFSTVGGRLRLWGGRGSVNLSVIDPFELQRFTFTTRDRAHVQTGSSTFSARRATVSVSYSFGRPPERDRRTRSTEEAERDDTGGRRIR
jgi:outer membrane receptor protein involved in Fe transport